MSKRALTRFHPPTRLDDDEARSGLKPPHGEGRGPVAVHRNGVAGLEGAVPRGPRRRCLEVQPREMRGLVDDAW